MIERVSRLLLLAVGVAPIFAQQASVPRSRASARYGQWGLDQSGEDKTIKPGNNFFQYANGNYVRTIVIPPDRTGYGLTSEMSMLTEERIRGLIEEQIEHGSPKDSDRKVTALYQAFMNESLIEQLGPGPLKHDLSRIRALRSKSDVARYMGASFRSFGASIFEIHIEPDLQDPRHYAVTFGQTRALGLPSRDYYLLPEFSKNKTVYESYVRQMLTLAGWPDPNESATAIVRLETQLAKISWPAEEERNREKLYHPTDRATLIERTKGFDVQAFLAGAHLQGERRFIVGESEEIPQLANIFMMTPLETLKAWEAFKVADQASALLPARFVKTEFELHERDLSGQAELEPRWKRALEVEDGTLGESVGRIYVSRYFPPSSKRAMEELVGNLKEAFHARLERVSWLSPATRKEALMKLDAMDLKVGYPGKWNNYSFTVTATDLYGDVKRGRSWEYLRQVQQLHRAVDRDEWGLLPQQDAAMYDSALNTGIFPAAFLQPPFFDPAADPAVNYGAIGVVIGHEMTHGFDDQGRKVDASGRLHDWWTAQDAADFKRQASALSAQYSSFEPLPGVHVNGDLTLGEDIADLGGINIALDAYHHSLRGGTAPVRDDTTGDQRFFLSCAQVWRSKRREDAVRRQLASDPHPPAEVRVNGEVRNSDDWYRAFKVSSGDALFVPPEDRVHIW